MKDSRILPEKIERWVAVVNFFILPFFIINLWSQHEWMGRLVAIVIAFGTLQLVLLWTSLNPRTEFIKKGAKLDRPEHKTAKKIAEPLLRLFVMIITMGCLLLNVSLFHDVLDLFSGASPLKMRGRAVYISTYRGFWPFYQRVTVAGHKRTLLLPYSPRIIRLNESYEFTYLPNSEFALEARKIEPETGSKNLQ